MAQPIKPAGSKTPKDQLPPPIATAFDNRVAAIQAQVTQLTGQMQSAQKYVTDTQLQIDALNLELTNLQASIGP